MEGKFIKIILEQYLYSDIVVFYLNVTKFTMSQINRILDLNNTGTDTNGAETRKFLEDIGFTNANGDFDYSESNDYKYAKEITRSTTKLDKEMNLENPSMSIVITVLDH